MGVKEVTAGAAWLDENFPGWEREIDLGTLDLESCQNCVCGQSLRGLVADNIYSGYHAAVALGAGVSDDWTWGRDFRQALTWAQNHGFAIDDSGESNNDSRESNERFAELDALWADLIKERFSSGNLSDADL